MSPLPELVRALLEPKTYIDSPQNIALVQTQMSFVFLTDNYVYKVKKPVNLGYLDYTTLDRRQLYCQREVELNKRLCPGVYLGVVPVTHDDDGILIEGKGRVIEYAVKMRRLPREAMMDVLLAQNQVSLPMVETIAHKLVEFHQQAETSTAISAFGKLNNITQNTEENFNQTEKYVGNTISTEKYKSIREYTDSFIRENGQLFLRRIARGRIRDGHGDLHAAHICFSNDICIYDCIEFNDRFRYCDVASEIAFLAMDLDLYGRADLSHYFVDAYIDMSQDSDITKLLKFYKCYRAYVRGKVESFKLDDPYISQAEKRAIGDTAVSYFNLADSYAEPRPNLFITAGLVGTGKSTFAQALAKQLGLAIISSDTTRKQLGAMPLTEHRFEEFGTGIYSAEFSRKTYDKMFTEARHILEVGGSVIIDASFANGEERLRARVLAEKMDAGFFILECTLDEKNVKQRLTQRLNNPSSISDGRWEIYELQKSQFDSVVRELPTHNVANHVIIDTSIPVNDILKQVLNKIN
ncbi:AAA family ATPase [Chloroflexota bacterium]